METNSGGRGKEGGRDAAGTLKGVTVPSWAEHEAHERQRDRRLFADLEASRDIRMVLLAETCSSKILC